MGIVSFLPAGTEMVYALGLRDALVGVSHECDYPIEARRHPVTVHAAIDFGGLSMREIDEAVSRHLAVGTRCFAQSITCSSANAYFPPNNLCTRRRVRTPTSFPSAPSSRRSLTNRGSYVPSGSMTSVPTSAKID